MFGKIKWTIKKGSVTHSCPNMHSAPAVGCPVDFRTWLAQDCIGVVKCVTWIREDEVIVEIA